MTTKRQKFLLILFGLIVVPLLFELSLCAAGSLFHSFRIKNIPIYATEKNKVRILCVGDSFSFGVGASKGYSYPEQLERILNKNMPAEEFTVYNAAIPGYNSSQLSKHFEEFIQKFDPQIVVVTIGINNKNIPLESNYFLFTNRGIKNQIYKIDYFLSSLRSYRFLKFIIGKMRNNIPAGNKKHPPENSIAKETNPADSAEFERLMKSGNDYFDKREANLAKGAFQGAIALNPHDERGYLGLAKVLIHCLGESELAIEQLYKAAKINPYNLETFDCLWVANYRLGRNKEAQEAIIKYISINPEEGYSGMKLAHLVSRGLPDIRDEETFKKLLKYDLENIVKSAKRTGLKIILQDYPSLFKGNEVIRLTANKTNVQFVDNQTVFEKLITSKGTDWKDPEYFAEDGHCNTNGYRIMAENVYEVIRPEVGKLR